MLAKRVHRMTVVCVICYLWVRTEKAEDLASLFHGELTWAHFTRVAQLLCFIVSRNPVAIPAQGVLTGGVWIAVKRDLFFSRLFRRTNIGPYIFHVH